MAETQKEPAAPANVKPTTAAELSAAFPELCAGVRAEGAAAERARIDGIAQIAAAMPGHDKLIADMKADGTTTAEQASMRIVLAEGQLRQRQLGGIRDVEKLTGKVAPAPVGEATPPPAQAATPDGWKAEFEASPALRAEFGGAEQYVAFKKAESEGRVKILRKAG